jgi:hypothetical protein
VLIGSPDILVNEIPNGWTLRLRRRIVDVAFSGTAYVAGHKITGLTSDSAKLWVKVDVEAGTATEQAGPPSDPFPANEEWFEKSKTAGDIHVTRL